MSSLAGVLAGVGSCIAHLYEFYDSNSIRKELNKNAMQVRQAGEHVASLEPSLQSELAPSVSHNIERSYARVRGAKSSIIGACCNFFNAINNTLIAGFQYRGLSNDILQKVHPVAAQASSTIAGSIDVYNGYIQGSTCLSAAKR